MPGSPLVTVGVVTWNSARDVDACISSVRAQDHERLELRVADNASSDDTRERLSSITDATERTFFDMNRGFAAAHNTLIGLSRGDFYLCLNPDVVLEPAFISTLVGAMMHRVDAGAATGTLLRRDNPVVIDSTGIVMTPNQRHLDRDAGRQDSGAQRGVEEVFGASGAAAFYRRAMLEDVCVDGEYFDEDFFAYREDADLAWRARLLGWRCLYVPAARALHGRRVTPERRATLPPEINRHSVRNRFLLRVKNQPAGHAFRFLFPTLARDTQVIGYVLLREWSSIPGLLDVVRLLPRALRKRRIIMHRRRVSTAELSRWFTNDPPRVP